MTEVYLIGGMVLVTFSVRYVMFALGNRVAFPRLLKRALQYVPPAVLTAITVPAVLMPQGPELWLSWENAYLVGAVVAALVGWFSKNLLLTIVIGMAVFLSWQWFLGVI